MMDQKKHLAAKRIKSPIELGTIGHNAAKKAAESKETGIPLPLDFENKNGKLLSEYFAPLLPWEICAIQAQTSNGKTMFKDWWIDRTVEHFEKQKLDKIIIDVHLEETLEQVAFSKFSKMSGTKTAEFARGDYKDFDGLKMMASKVGEIPVWHIGVSAEDADDAPDLTLSNIFRAIMALKNGELTGSEWNIGLVSVDYLQVLPFDNEVTRQKMENQRRLQVARDVNILRAMTTKIESPILAPLQAKQDLRGVVEPYHIPQMYDGQETSTIAQRFDRILSLWMPSSTHPNLLGSTIDGKEESVQVGPNNMFLQVTKQRGGLPKGEKWHFGWDFKKYEIRPLKTRVERISFNG
ncbi:MAG: hypothetical protein GY755_04710 [Chloroflexi bacterium]|nr:hypothetical protein [Chloroflexota bacterium]